jgi:hypothetical protein
LAKPAPLANVVAKDCSGNRIIPARTPGMATTHSTQTKPDALAQTVLLQCLQGIVGATREKTATIAQHGTDRQLVATNQPEQWPQDQLTSIRQPVKQRISPRQSLNCCLSCGASPGWLMVASTARPDRNLRTRSPRTTETPPVPWRLIALRKLAARAKRLGTIRPSLATAS